MLKLFGRINCYQPQHTEIILQIVYGSSLFFMINFETSIDAQ